MTKSKWCHKEGVTEGSWSQWQTTVHENVMRTLCTHTVSGAEQQRQIVLCVCVVVCVYICVHKFNIFINIFINIYKIFINININIYIYDIYIYIYIIYTLYCNWLVLTLSAATIVTGGSYDYRIFKRLQRSCPDVKPRPQFRAQFVRHFRPRPVGPPNIAQDWARKHGDVES